MTPVLSRPDAATLSGGNSKYRGQLDARFSERSQPAKLQNKFVGQLRFGASLSVGAIKSVLAHAVRKIDFLICGKEVGGVYASRGVAGVADEKTRWNWTIGNLVHDPMGKLDLVADTENAVPLIVRGGRPQPARVSFDEFGRKPLFNCHGVYSAIFLLILGASTALAQTKNPPIIVGQFLGQNDTDPSVSLPVSEAQSALNVESSLSGAALLKRPGFSRFASLTISTAQPTGAFSFVDTSGNRQDIVCQDHNCAKSTNSGAFVVFLSTAGGTCVPTRWSFVQINGTMYAANDCRDPIFTYNGAIRSPLSSSAPLGSILELTKDRLVVSDISASPNNVYYSQSGTYSNFTTGLNSADPYVDPIGSPGDRVQGLKWALGRLFIFKTTSITACLLGDQYSSRCFPVSNTIGTSDPLSIVEVPGALYFKGSDKNFWMLDENGVQGPISKKISNLVATQTSGSVQSNTQTSQADWQAGTQSPTGTWDTSTISGSIFPSSFTMLDASTTTFAQGTCLGCGTSPRGDVLFAGVTSTYSWRYDANVVPDSDGWTNFAPDTTESVAGSSLTITAPAGSLNQSFRRSLVSSTSQFMVARGAVVGGTGSPSRLTFALLSSTASVSVTISTTQVSYSWSGGASTVESLSQPNYSTYTVIVDSNGAGVSFWRNGVFKASGTFSGITFTNAQIILSPSSSGKTYGFVDFFHTSTGVPNPGAADIVSIATFTSRIIDLSVTTPTAGGFNISSYSVTGTTFTFSIRQSTSPNNDLWGSYVQVVSPSTPSINQRYAQYRSTFTNLNLTESPGFVKVLMPYVSTGSFRTQCIQPGTAISGWGILSCAQTTAGNGSEVFYATSAATCATLPTGIPTSWQTSVTNNATLTISTNAAVYIGWRSLLTSATDQAQVDACTLYWNNGTASPPSWGAYDSVKNAVYWSAAINNSATANRVLKYDLNLNQWYPFGLNAGVIYRNTNGVFFGDSTGGYWNQYGGVTSDNGSAINAYWISKDFGNQANPFVDNNFTQLSLVTKNQVTGSMTVGYTTSDNATGSFAVSLSTTSGVVYVHANQYFPLMSPRQFININLGNNATTGFEVDGLMLEYTSFPWSPENP